MDMLYRAYSNPLDLVNVYINQGRFGTFVEEFLKLEKERRKADHEKEQDRKLWLAYLISNSDTSYGEWKNRIVNKAEIGNDENLDDEGIKAIITNLFPNHTGGQNGGG